MAVAATVNAGPFWFHRSRFIAWFKQKDVHAENVNYPYAMYKYRRCGARTKLAAGFSEKRKHGALG